MESLFDDVSGGYVTQALLQSMQVNHVILILVTPTFIQIFVKLPCSCQARCPGNLECGFINKLTNIHTVILQRQRNHLQGASLRTSTKKCFHYEKEENVRQHRLAFHIALVPDPNA